MAKKQYGNLGPTPKPSGAKRAAKASGGVSTPKAKRIASTVNAEAMARGPKGGRDVKAFGGAPTLTGGVQHGERGLNTGKAATGRIYPPTFGGGRATRTRPRPRGTGLQN